MANQIEIKNEIIKLHLQGGLSQAKIGKQVGTSQSFVSTTVRAYNDGSFVYSPDAVDEQPIDECEQSSEPMSDELIDTTETQIVSDSECEQSTTETSDEPSATIEPTNISDSECEQSTTEPSDEPPTTIETPAPSNPIKQPTTLSSDTTITSEYEQKKPKTKLDKSKITFTNHGLWLNQFALQMLNNPTHLAYSFDSENVNLYIAPYDENNLLPFYTCSAKCSKNYTKTTNKPLINEIQEILEGEFKGNINVNLDKDAFKIQFNFKFENGQFIIHIPSMISNVSVELV